jgi:hypothetical protein
VSTAGFQRPPPRACLTLVACHGWPTDWTEQTVTKREAACIGSPSHLASWGGATLLLALAWAVLFVYAWVTDGIGPSQDVRNPPKKRGRRLTYVAAPAEPRSRSSSETGYAAPSQSSSPASSLSSSTNS